MTRALSLVLLVVVGTPASAKSAGEDHPGREAPTPAAAVAAFKAGRSMPRRQPLRPRRIPSWPRLWTLGPKPICAQVDGSGQASRPRDDRRRSPVVGAGHMDGSPGGNAR